MEYSDLTVDVIKAISDGKDDVYRGLTGEEVELGKKIASLYRSLPKDLGADLAKVVSRSLPCANIFRNIWWYSVLVNVSFDAEIMKNFILIADSERDQLSPVNMHFLYYQFTSLIFNHPSLSSDRIYLWKFYADTVNMYRFIIDIKESYVPIGERNKDLVVVIACQMLEIQHGPTKTALDRCNTLIRKMHKNVFLINTAEVCSARGSMSFYNAQIGNYNERLKEGKSLTYKDITVPYFQCDNNMPDASVIMALIEQITNLKPYTILSIGPSLLSELINPIIPVLTIGLGPSELTPTLTKYQTLSRPLQEHDREELNLIGYDESNVIEALFTSGLKEQTETVSREELGIPADAFVLTTVGGRLDAEVTEEYLEMLENVAKQRDNLFVAFWGGFSSFAYKIEHFPVLKTRAKFMGFCNDILSRIENCNLYVNPIRSGGGTSCVEAMSKGLPVVATGYGDVAINCGPDFIVKDYDEMCQMILKYIDDTDFYKSQSEKALTRAKELLDTDANLEKLIDDYVNREEGMKDYAEDR